MESDNPYGKDWTRDEIDLVVSSYFAMLRRELAREPFIKAAINRDVQEATGRSKGSVERKFQNVSAVLMQLGLPWVIGYAPLANYQLALMDGIERFLVRNSDFVSTLEHPQTLELAEHQQLFIGPAPVSSGLPNEEPDSMRRLVRKFDPADRDARNRKLGTSGEELVLHFERERLNTERPDLAGKVRWVAQEDGDGAGYDILSFNSAGEERLIEVKTTIGHAITPFYLSANELALSNERPREFSLIRVYDFIRNPRAFELRSPLQNFVKLTAQTYRANFP